MNSAIIPAVWREGPLLSASYQFHGFPVCLASTMRRAHQERERERRKEGGRQKLASISNEMNLKFVGYILFLMIKKGE